MKEITEWESNKAKELIKEWRDWQEGDGKVPQPYWPKWSGIAVVLLESIVKEIEGNGERGNVPGKQDS